MRIDENFDKKNHLMKKRKCVIDEKREGDEHEKFLAYGEFDRIGFEKITRFSRFRDVPEKSKIWIGDRQTLLVYEISDDKISDAVFYDNGNFFIHEDKKAVQSEHLFIGITILQFKDSQKDNQTDMGAFLRCCKKNIMQLVKNEMPHIKCSVLGTLGSFGLTIIWLADQYCDVLHMVTKIRNTDITSSNITQNKSVFLSSYTIFAQNHPHGVNWEDKVEHIVGQAILRLTLKKGISKNMLTKIKNWKTQEAKIYHSAGEHDIVFRMDSSKAFNIFSDNKDLFIGEEFVRENVLQTNLQLCEVLCEEKEQDISYSSDEKKIGEVEPNYFSELTGIQENYKNLRAKFKSFPSTAGMIDTLDWLYSDYIAKISTASNEMWVSNFSYQFLKILETLTNFVDKLEDVGMLKKGALQNINDLLSDFERQISHIAESNNLILGTPTCQFRYSGQNNLTLYSYFGIIKNILQSIYENQKVCSQAEIIPLIVADIVPIIKSSLFIDYNNKDDARIITINLPMMSLYDPVCYYPYFLHEIAHYVVPKDRNIRNRILGCLISVEMFGSVCKEIIIQKQELETEGEIRQLNVLFKDCLLTYAYSFVIEHYQDYIEIQKGDYTTYSSVDKTALTAEKYEEEIYMQWLNWINSKERIDLTNNPIYLFFCYLYNDRQKLMTGLDRWKDKKQIEGEDVENLVGGIRDFFDMIEGIVNNPEHETQDAAFAELMNYLNDEICGDAMLVIDAVREALADITMITMGNMDLAEYLILFTKTKRELLLNPDNEIDVQDIIRLGMCLDFLNRQKENDGILIGIMDGAKEDFINLYCGLYSSTYKSEEEQNSIFQQAEKWFDYWRICFQEYDLRYRIYALLFRELQEQLLQVADQDGYSEGREESIYWKKYAETLGEYGNYIRNSTAEKSEVQWKEKKTFIDDQIFNLNIDLIHRFQHQIDFKELNEKRKNRITNIKLSSYENPKFPCDRLKVNKEIFLYNKVRKQRHLWQYEISTVGQLGELTSSIAEALKKSNSRVLGKNEYPIWYRGQQSVDYKLIPSIMRKFKKQKEKQKNVEEFSLVKFIRKEFEEFRFRADGSQETIERIGYTVGDYIALMQHYSVPSNFLDWTEDALSALYFALEGFLDEKVEKTDKDAALYIFSPALYNHARKRMLLTKAKMDKRQLELEKEVFNNAQEGIPNLTVSFNDGKYEMYLLGKEEYKDDNSTPFSSQTERNRKLIFYLPVAIYIPRLNRRIQAQNGIFLAYNIYTSPDTKDEFDYISLEEIQKFYFELFQDDTEEEVCPFLYKIMIKKEEREKVASWVSSFGMSKEKCYPELSNIGERIMK